MEYPKINFGTYRLKDSEILNKSLEIALSSEANYRGIDTAALYGNQHIIGKFLKTNEINRNDIFITSKLNPKNTKSENDIIKCITNTLNELQTDYIDLFLLHCPDNIKICWDIIERFHNMGILRNIGVSNHSIDNMKTIMNNSTTKIFTNQIELSPFLRREDTVQFMKENNIIVSAHSSLTKGEMLHHETLKELATKHNTTPAQILLKWDIENDYIIMPRSKDPLHIKENISVMNNTHFKLNEDMDILNSIQEKYITHPKYNF